MRIVWLLVFFLLVASVTDQGQSINDPFDAQVRERSLLVEHIGEELLNGKITLEQLKKYREEGFGLINYFGPEEEADSE